MTLYNLTYREASHNFSKKSYANISANSPLTNDTVNFPHLNKYDASPVFKRKKFDSDSDIEESTSQKKNYTINVPKKIKPRLNYNRSQ